MAEAGKYAPFVGTWKEKDRGDFNAVMTSFANLGMFKRNALKMATLTWTISVEGETLTVVAFTGETTTLKEGETVTNEEKKQKVTLVKGEGFVMQVVKDGKTQTVTRTVDGNTMTQVHKIDGMDCTVTLTKQ